MEFFLWGIITGIGFSFIYATAFVYWILKDHQNPQ